MENSGQIITFYSYKGGTGRTMALANIACLLTRKDDPQDKPLRILAIDWDFEAPGLHRFLQPYLTPESAERFDESPGCLELFEQLAFTRMSFNPKDFVGNRTRARALLDTFRFETYTLSTIFPGLQIMKAGRFNEDYSRRFNEFNWKDLFDSTVGLFAGVADYLRANFDYVLIDSRTGVTDTSGICSVLLPDKLVVVFTPNQQSLTGIENLISRAVAYRKGSPDGRPLTVFPLPSRVEMARPQLLEAWRNGSTADTAIISLLPKGMTGYQQTFEKLFVKIYGRKTIRLEEYFNEVMLQHIPDYAYGEPLAVALEATESRMSLSSSYSAFKARLIELDVPWASIKTVRLEREILSRCQKMIGLAEQGSIDEALKHAFTLIEQKPPLSIMEGTIEAILAVAKLIYPRNRSAGSSLVRQCTQVALHEPDIDPIILGQLLLDAGKLSQECGDLPLAIELLSESAAKFAKSFGSDHPATVMALDQLASALYEHGDFAASQSLSEKNLLVGRSSFGEQHPNTVRAVRNLAQTLYAQGDLSGARRLQEQVVADASRLLGEEDPDTLSGLNDLALTLSAQGDYARARELQERALETSRRVLGPDHPNTLTAISNFAQTLYEQGNYAEARELQEYALSRLRQALGDEHPLVLTAMLNLAGTQFAQGELATARHLEEEVLGARSRVLGEEHRDTLNAMNNLAQTLSAQGDHAAAQALQERVLALHIRILGDNHPDTLTAMNNLAQTLFNSGDFPGARALEERVLVGRQQFLGPDQPETLIAMNNLGRTFAASGELASAESLLIRALEGSRQVLGVQHPVTLRAALNLARTLGLRGNYAGAEKLQVEVLQLYLSTLGEQNPDTLAAMNALAVTFRQQHQFERARALGEQVLELRGKVLGDSHPQTIEAMRDLSKTLRAQGENDRAFELLTRALELQSKTQNKS